MADWSFQANDFGRLGPGRRIAGYLLEEQVGAGGMAVVFRARDEVLGRLVAVKVIAPSMADDEEFRARFMRESRMAAAVDSPHVIPVYAAGEYEGLLYIATRFVAGGDLAGLLRRAGGRLAAGRAASLVAQVASALDAAHAIGLVHRDVKPGNILVDSVPERPEHTFLTDFGLSKRASVTSAGLTLSGQFVGTPDYSAPEQINGGQLDGRTDQYALACVAFVLLTGEVPFRRDSPMSTLYAHVSGPVPSVTRLRPELPPAVDRVFARAMAKDPADRYAGCGVFAEELRAALVDARSATSAAGPASDPGGYQLPSFLSGPAPTAGPSGGTRRPAKRAARPGRRKPWRFGWHRKHDVDGRVVPENPLAAGSGGSRGGPPEPPTLNGPVDPDDIDGRDQFFAALGAVRQHADLSPKDVAAVIGLPLRRVCGYFDGKHLPAERDILRQILLACGTPDQELPRWEAALVRVRSQRSQAASTRRRQPRGAGRGDDRPSADPLGDPADDQPGDDGLLFRVYIPKTQLYAEQRREMLRLFRVWLTTVQGQDVREQDFGTKEGDTVAFFVAPGQPRPPLREDYREFANFVEHCAHDPATALTRLTEIGIDESTGTVVVADYAKKIHRVEMDLRHSRESKLLVLQQAFEGELLDRGGAPQGIATLRFKIRTLLEEVVPPPTAGTAMPAINGSKQARPDAQAARDAYAAGHDLHIHVGEPAPPPSQLHMTINAQQVIYTAMENIQGTENFGPEAKRLLFLVNQYGNGHAGPLLSALHELEDPGIPVTIKAEARQRIAAFLAGLPGVLPNFRIAPTLTRYLETNPGDGGSPGISA